jgi:hypothetical protein
MKTSIAARPSLHDLVKAASAGALSRVNISEEAARQQRVISEEKTASVASANENVSTDYANQLAGALDFVSEKLASGANLAGAYKLSEHHVEPGQGPGALTVLESNVKGAPPGPGGQGHGHSMQVAANPPVEKGRPQEHSPSNMGTNYTHAPGAGGHPLEKNNSAKLLEANRAALAKMASAGRKTASATCSKCNKEKCECAKTASPNTMSLVDYMLSQTKQAEDAINPAQISAGAAVPPETSASGEPGGQPVGGAPNGNTGLVSSNESAINYKRNAAYSGRKADLAKYWQEPALSSATDTTLQQAFSHTGEAGTKFGSAPTIKVAAARALLLKLAEQAEEKKAEKEKDEGMADGAPLFAPRPGISSTIKKVTQVPRPGGIGKAVGALAKAVK